MWWSPGPAADRDKRSSRAGGSTLDAAQHQVLDRIIADGAYRSFEEARTFAQSLNLKSGAEWRTQSEDLPADIPANPNQIYKNNGWAGMGDWLGTGTVAA